MTRRIRLRCHGTHNKPWYWFTYGVSTHIYSRMGHTPRAPIERSPCIAQHTRCSFAAQVRNVTGGLARSLLLQHCSVVIGMCRPDLNDRYRYMRGAFVWGPVLCVQGTKFIEKIMSKQNALKKAPLCERGHKTFTWLHCRGLQMNKIISLYIFYPKAMTSRNEQTSLIWLIQSVYIKNY
jgi:hypothetical protein